MKTFAQIDIENKGNYLKLLSVISKLSRLFSESQVPFLYYRAAENIFCRSFDAENLSRSDTAFDASYHSKGVGLKTFISNGNSLEKVAEFNSLSNTLQNFKGKELAIELSKYRNERINLANRLYNIDSAIYHIVARRENELQLFETDYNTINIDRINVTKKSKSSLHFNDEIHEYSYNFSKSTLFRRFLTPQNAYKLPIEILEDPYETLLKIFSEKLSLSKAENLLIAGKNFVILPLYGHKNKQKFVFEKSALNQWNAGGRKRNISEVYLQITADIHNNFPDFFPARDKYFSLKVPTGEILQAKVCQDNSKALMTNPNKALSDWLLRKVLKLKEGELATIEKLDLLGFDSVMIQKQNDDEFSIDIVKTDSYEDFKINFKDKKKKKKL